ncbi:Na+/H+ antiporter NhaA [Komagataeibacter oboediens]|uniref:Na(+)/H(+) antiporter NhaA n=1 Tax=Komagataeibacter oboediens TaxID=65958 RepID=A0ABS5SNK9_9PROT|nr:Na+/H+ antiporter NhaA [Komagataeibacter oboediens]MBL7232179.1 Na+/H+ antiporter NhaA [Komagataeibacter oboediens]MBT0675778.1 Na+/H+ antiporter NhaA [Komagataeibacter oboediens]MBT0677828.1 Na+/H+ antiporter NhaA [Komagataeibacter oboediens]
MTDTSSTLPGGIRRFFISPSAGTTALLLASMLGLALANSPEAAYYHRLVTLPMRLPLLGAHGPTDMGSWVSDGLMTLFFLVVIADIKTEIISGHLSSPRKIALPLIGAAGGMIMPALTYLMVTHGHAGTSHGWAIPVATDAAFTLPVMLVLGSRVSAGARTWLMALAVFDDILGILVIALFYGTALCWPALLVAGLVTLGMICLNRAGIRALWPYAGGGMLLWVSFLNSGLHPTLAALVTGLCLPAMPSGTTGKQRSPLDTVTAVVNPVVTWGVLPLFGFINLGVSLVGLHASMLLAPVPLGIILALLVGKPTGVFGATMLAFQLKLSPLPAATSIGMLFGLSLLCGIGFTISLFIADLAFSGSEFETPARIGIFTGSVIAALIGWVWLRFSPLRADPAPARC